jgi:membrane-associated phospholipid phosphatase
MGPTLTSPGNLHALHRLLPLALLYCLSNARGTSPVETAGNVMAFAIPATAYATTFAVGDKEGRIQFYKSFAVNAETTLALKYAINKPRPENNGDHAFTSGHTSFSFQGATFIHRRYGLAYGIPAYLGAVCVGWSRVEADQHDWVDVSAGAAIGILCSCFFTTPYKGFSVAPMVENETYGLSINKTW